jgi:hypothetical protein
MIVKTETGSIYEIDMKNMKMRRSNSEESLRRDGEWITMLKEPIIELGRTMILFLEPLSEYQSITTRFTTIVKEIKD